MNALVAAAVALLVGTLLYLSLDSGIFRPPAEWFFSLPLLGLAGIFAGGAWGAKVGGLPRRMPLLAGLSAGVGTYALVRLVAFS